MNEGEARLRERLLALRDERYQRFQCRLMPTVAPETVIGVRMPALRRLAKEFAPSPDAAAFLRRLPHDYYEENNLHGLLIAQVRDYDACVAALDAFLPYVDNWATCDLIRPKSFAGHPPALREKISDWLASGHSYTVRFGIEMLMSFYLDAAFRPEYPALVAAVRSEEYYVNMMIAWYFATALAKQYETALPWLEQRRLPPWTHNKTVQKAIESYRITDEQKQYLRTLRVK